MVSWLRKKKSRGQATAADKKKIANGKRLYDSIKGKSIHCPLINADVRFTNKGWKHLNDKRRNIPDILRRIDLLPYVDSIVKSPTGLTASKTDPNCTILYGVRTVNKGKSPQKINIKVNISKDKAGNYSFLSIC